MFHTRERPRGTTILWCKILDMEPRNSEGAVPERKVDEKKVLFNQLFEQKKKIDSEPLPIDVSSSYGLPLCLGLREVKYSGLKIGVNAAYVVGVFEDRRGLGGKDEFRPIGYMVLERGPLYLECRSSDAMKNVFGGPLLNQSFDTKVNDKYFVPLSHATNSENGIEVGMGQTKKTIRREKLKELGLEEQFLDERKFDDSSPYGRRGIGSIMVDLATDLAEREHLDVFLYKCTPDSINLLTSIKNKGGHEVKIEKIPGERYTHAWIKAWSR